MCTSCGNLNNWNYVSRSCGCGCTTRGAKGEPGIQGRTGAAGTTTISAGSITNSMLAKIVISTPTFTANDYTLILTDDGKKLELSNGATPGTLTIPLNATVPFEIGTQIIFSQTGSGTITVAATGGVTIQSQGALLALNGQYAGGSLIKVAENTWELFGNLA